ncbi:MAG: hypothetical protein GEV07_07725 [Streptosporangiales bacterium]|nr:hypothetical protein [Streptosporangiales bacterium]
MLDTLPHVRSPRRVALAGLLTAVLVLAGCGGQPQTSNTDVATVALDAGDEPTYILPSDPQCTAVNNHYFRSLIYKPLYWYGGVLGNEFALNEELSLAEPPEYNGSNDQVTITLKDYNWSDGEPVSARDIAFYVNLYRASKAKWGCYAPGSVPDNIERMDITGEKSIVLHLDKSYSPKWFDVQQLGGIIPLPQHAWDKTSDDGEIGNHHETDKGAAAVFDFLTGKAKSLSSYDSEPLWEVVNGPWALDEFDPRGDIAFVPNKKYSGKDKPKLSKLVEKRFTTEQAEFNALMADDTLTTGYIPSQYTSRKKQVENKGYRVYAKNNFGINYIQLNHASNAAGPLLSQLYVRQALQHMVDQPEYIKRAHNGEAFAVYGPVPIKPKNPYVSEYVKSVPYPHDPDKASQLLDEHGWDVKPDGVSVCARPGTAANQCGKGIARGMKLEFRLVYTQDPTNDRMMQAFKSSAAAAGINVKLRKTTQEQVFSVTNICKRGSRRCDWDAAYWGGWQFGPYPSGEELYKSGASENNFNNPKADRLIEATQTESGLEHMTAYQDYIAKQVPVLFMPRNQGASSVVRSDLKGFKRAEQGLFEDFYPQYWYFDE